MRPRTLSESWAVAFFWLCSGAAAAPLLAQEALLPDSVVYHITRRSRLEVKVGKAGLLASLFGHEHRFKAVAFSGRVVYVPRDPSRSRVAISVRADSLDLVSAADSVDRAKILETMRSKVLAVDRFPEISFVSREVKPGPNRLELVGDFTLVGVTRPLRVQAELEVTFSELTAAARFSLRQSDFGIKPYSTALGTIKVSDRLDFEVELSGVRGDADTSGQMGEGPPSVRRRIQ